MRGCQKERDERAMSRTRTRLYLIPMLVPVAFAASVAAQPKDHDRAANVPAVMWRSPGDVASLDLRHGAGGKAHAPDSHGAFTFIKEDLQATSPKFEIEDDHGVRWRVKLGQEPGSETAATRFLWAAGYFVDEDYYLATLNVRGMPTLQRGASFVRADGTVQRVRLERQLKGVEKRGEWDWFDNPFVGRRELNGLRVMMSLLNNWDLSEANNAIVERGGERRYFVADVGATFGQTGNSLTRSKSVSEDYADSTFVEKTTPGFVDFVLHSRPFFLSAVNVPNYLDRTRMEQVTRHIPRADAQWLGHRLSRLSGEQIRDAFRGAGYTHQEVELYTRAMRRRIAELAAL